MIRLWLSNATRGCNLNSEAQTLQALQKASILIYRCEIYFLYYAISCIHFIYIFFNSKKKKKKKKTVKSPIKYFESTHPESGQSGDIKRTIF